MASFSGFDKARLCTSVDEVKNFIDGRYLSASEAAWRFMEYDMTRRDPAVTSLPVHLEGFDLVYYDEGEAETAKTDQTSPLVRYFKRPNALEFDNITYMEYYKVFQVAKTAAKTAKQQWTDNVPPPNEKQVYRRFKPHVTPMHNIRMQCFKVWYLRLLLRNSPARSFAELRTVSLSCCKASFFTYFTQQFPAICSNLTAFFKVEGNTYETYGQAAKALGLLADVCESQICMKEAVSDLCTP